MDIEKRLNKIWNQDYINSLPEFIKERGFCYSINKTQKDILITGINPSFRVGFDKNGSFSFDIQETFKGKYDNYWGPLKKMIYDVEEGIDLKDTTAYLDILFYREKEQGVLSREILSAENGFRFIIDQLNLTQHIIEDIIKPKLIIVKNKGSAAYWGKLANKDIIWMGYDFEFVESFEPGELYKIKGLLNSKDRIAPEINSSSIKNALVLFTQHINQFTKKEKRPKANLIAELLNRTI